MTEIKIIRRVWLTYNQTIELNRIKAIKFYATVNLIFKTL